MVSVWKKGDNEQEVMGEGGGWSSRGGDVEGQFTFDPLQVQSGSIGTVPLFCSH